MGTGPSSTRTARASSAGAAVRPSWDVATGTGTARSNTETASTRLQPAQAALELLASVLSRPFVQALKQLAQATLELPASVAGCGVGRGNAGRNWKLLGGGGFRQGAVTGGTRMHARRHEQVLWAVVVSG